MSQAARLAAALVPALHERGLTLAVAESLTGGLVMPRAWDVGIAGRGIGTGREGSYTVEAFVRPGPPRPAEQTIVMGGRVPFCDGESLSPQAP